MHTPIHSVGFLLNPLYHAMKPWLHEDVMRDFYLLMAQWDIENCNDSTVGATVIELNQYTEYDFAAPRSVVEKYLGKIRKPQSIYDMLDSWNLHKHDTPGQTTTSAAPKSGIPTIKGFWTVFGVGQPGLQSLATKCIVQSISQSACETNFSDFSYIVSEKRNRLNFETQKKLVYVYCNLRLLA